jgi:3-oxoacyl-[acyl-carrier-protein] synthase III
VLGVHLGGAPDGIDVLHVPAGREYVVMDGPELFRRATRAIGESSRAALGQAGMSADDVDLFVPHQANVRIIEAAARRLGIPAERTLVNLDHLGNTSAASVPLALADARAAGRLHEGSQVLLAGIGAGLTWASCVVRWSR